MSRGLFVFRSSQLHALEMSQTLMDIEKSCHFRYIRVQGNVTECQFSFSENNTM